MMSPPSKLAIIIPVYRDHEALQQCLGRLQKQGLASRAVVALGERDGASESMAEAAGATTVYAEGSGRGRQLNAAARQCGGEVLLFLHADTVLPEQAEEMILVAMGKGFVGGAFARRFQPSSWFLRVTCRLADWRGRWYGWFLGDQAIFIRRTGFDQLGGLQEWSVFEDLDLSRRMRRAGPTCLLKPGVVSSARRFERYGEIRQTMMDFGLTLQYLFGRKRQW